MAIVPAQPGYPGDFGKAFESEDLLRKARELCKTGNLLKDSDDIVYGTPPGLVSIVDLSHEMHRACSRLAKVLEDAGWFQVLEFPGYYFPPESKEGLE
jgi:hypothetical protein